MVITSTLAAIVGAGVGITAAVGIILIRKGPGWDSSVSI
jgi:hypothetical protein